MKPTAIALFAKAPRPGFVKTRLTSQLTPEEAAEFHRLCAIGAWTKLVSMSQVECYWYCDQRWPEFEALAGADRFRLQSGPDLGARMYHCLDELLSNGRGRAMVIGSDSPTLPTAHVLAAEGALRAENTAVLGPCEDGGYYVIGATRSDPAMFRGVAWSETETCEQTVAALTAARYQVELAPSWWDVDFPADLERLQVDPKLPGRLRRWFDGID